MHYSIIHITKKNHRWNSLQIAYKRILSVLPHLNQVCFEQGIAIIEKRDAEMLEQIVQIVTPFKEFTEALSREGAPTISLLLPGLENLILTLTSFKEV